MKFAAPRLNLSIAVLCLRKARLSSSKGDYLDMPMLAGAGAGAGFDAQAPRPSEATAKAAMAANLTNFMNVSPPFSAGSSGIKSATRPGHNENFDPVAGQAAISTAVPTGTRS